MDFTYVLARPEDDPEIRRLLAASPMPGQLTVTFEREPNYFLGNSTAGHFCQVILARQADTGELAGMMCRAGRPYFINGQPQMCGYLTQLRVAGKFQGRWLPAKGIPLLKELERDGQTPVYFMAISDENRAMQALLGRRPGNAFPPTRPLAAITTLGIILRRPLRSLPAAFSVERGSKEKLEEIVAFLGQEGAAKQFFPAYTLADFTTLDTARGFDPADFVVARREGRIIGVIGLWDQSSYKQTVVQAYVPGLRRLRPFYNLGARIFGAQPLPAPGEHIHSVYASFICIQGNNPQVFAVLLREIYNLAAARCYAHLMLGLTSDDPLLPVARKYPAIAYYSHWHACAWNGLDEFCARLDGRVPYVEIALL